MRLSDDHKTGRVTNSARFAPVPETAQSSSCRADQPAGHGMPRRDCHVTDPIGGDVSFADRNVGAFQLRQRTMQTMAAQRRLAPGSFTLLLTAGIALSGMTTTLAAPTPPPQAQAPRF